MSSNLSANMRATAEAFIMAFDGKWSLEAAMAPRAPECEHTILPSSLGHPKNRTNDEWATYFKPVEKLGIVGKMTIEDYVANSTARRAVCRSSLSATTPAGSYSNEYIWFLTFDESGQKIVSITEFLDSKAATDLVAKLREGGHLERH